MASKQFDWEDAALYPVYVGAAAVATGIGSIQTLGVNWSDTLLDLGFGELTIAVALMVGALVWVFVTNDTDAVRKAQRGDKKETIILGATAGFILTSAFAPSVLELIPGLGSGGPTSIATVIALSAGYALLSWIH